MDAILDREKGDPTGPEHERFAHLSPVLDLDRFSLCKVGGVRASLLLGCALGWDLWA